MDRVGTGRGPPRGRAMVLDLVVLATLATACTTNPGHVPSRSASGAPSAGRSGAGPDTHTAQVMLAWTPVRLPDGFAAAVAQLPEVASAVPVVGGTVWMRRSQRATGEVVDQPPAGHAIPLDLAGADLASYASLDPTWARLAGLSAGEVVLGATSARLRRVGPGATVTVGAIPLRVAAVVPDAEVGFTELFTTAATAARLGVTTPRYLLIEPKAGTGWQQVAARVRALVPGERQLRVVDPGATRFLRHGASVLPPVLQKQYFGEFAVHLPPGRDGWLTLDPDWTAAYLRTEEVPILGRITCNSAMLPALRSALGELVRRGLSSLVNPHDYGGCFAARLIPGRDTGDISHHAWGSAIDLNVSANPLGAPSRQDPRLVEVFRRWGFTWGGTWMVRDAMHFELLPPPDAATPSDSPPGPGASSGPSRGS